MSALSKERGEGRMVTRRLISSWYWWGGVTQMITGTYVVSSTLPIRDHLFYLG